jgi:hypothetical protein
MSLTDARVRRIDAGATDVADATSADATVRAVVVREEGLGASASRVRRVFPVANACVRFR